MLGLLLFVIWKSRAGIHAFYVSGDPVPLFEDVAGSIGGSYMAMVDALAAAPSAEGVVAQFTLLGVFVVNAAGIIWFFRAPVFMVRLVRGEDYSPIAWWTMTGLLYVVLVWADSGVVPVLEHLDVLRNLPVLLDVPGRDFVLEWVFDLPEGSGGGVNESVNATRQ